jgi:hypothetical protein
MEEVTKLVTLLGEHSLSRTEFRLYLSMFQTEDACSSHHDVLLRALAKIAKATSDSLEPTHYLRFPLLICTTHMDQEE